MPIQNPRKYSTELCDDKMTFKDCELAILRHTVDEIEGQNQKKMANGEEIAKMISILEGFLIRKKLVCYGGTAINNVLPMSVQFYNRDIEIPDYDFYSSHAMDDAIELADIYHDAGYLEVEAKAGVHHGTYKVFVDFIPMADITYLPDELFSEVLKDSVTVAGIKYAPINFLRMNMFLELSRPDGDVSRWEKVLKRLTLLNTHYPFKTDFDCMAVDFQRKMLTDAEASGNIYDIVRKVFVELEVVFFGGYASSLYSQHMPEKQRKLVGKIPDFDVLAEEPDKVAMIVCERLTEGKFKNVRSIVHEPIGDMLDRHIEIRVGKETVAFIYKPMACHSYNQVKIDGHMINIATIDTMLTFYLAFYYVNEPYYPRDRILCMAKFLFEVEQSNRLEQTGILKRFSMDCYGVQSTLDEIRTEKATKFKELASKRGTREYNMWFLKYNPATKSAFSNKSDETQEPPKKGSPRKNRRLTKKIHRKVHKLKKRRTYGRDFLF